MDAVSEKIIPRPTQAIPGERHRVMTDTSMFDFSAELIMAGGTAAETDYTV